MAASKKGRREIPPETKEAALAALQSGKRLNDVADEYKVSVATLSLWKRAAKSGVATPKRSIKGDENRQIELLQIEVDYLRKKLAYYEK
jgi:transposase-like protein